MYGIPGVIVTGDNGLSSPEQNSVVCGFQRGDSLYMTIPNAENGHARMELLGSHVCKVGATRAMEATCESCSSVIGGCETGTEDSSIGYSRVSAPQCKLVVQATGSGNHRRESSDLQQKDNGNSTFTEHMREPAAAVTPKKDATGEQKGPCGRPMAAERTGDNTTEQKPFTQEDKAQDPEENYATISDLIGNEEEEEEGEDPYCLVGPSSDNTSMCSGIFSKDQHLAKGGQERESDLGHFHSMYALLGETKSMEDLHERSQVEIQRMKAMMTMTTTTTRGASVGAPGNGLLEDLGGSFTLLTDNPCHNEDMDRLSYGGADAHHDSRHLSTTTTAVAAATQHRLSMTLPQITVGPADQSSEVIATPPCPSSHCLPVITIQATTTLQDVGVAMTVGNPTPLQGQSIDGNGCHFPNRSNTGNSIPPH